MVNANTVSDLPADAGASHPASDLLLLGADLRAGIGVGDFTRRLAVAWRSQGRCCTLADRAGREGGAPTKTAEVFLQFVPYAWHPRGLIGRQVRNEIVARCEDRRVVVFMHELWIGEATGDPLPARILGCWQRHGVTRLLGALRPAAIFTSNEAYRAMLAREGLVADVCALPGNLPTPDPADRLAAATWLRDRGLDGVKFAAVFGAIHPEWDGASALRSWMQHLGASKQEGVVLTLGRNGPAAGSVLARLAAAVPGMRIERGGALPARLLAAVLARATLGLATTPWALIGKSGTVAAFQEAGVPVLVTRDDWRWRRGETPARAEEPGLRLWREGLDWDGLLAERKPRASAIDKLVQMLAQRLAGDGRSTT